MEIQDNYLSVIWTWIVSLENFSLELNLKHISKKRNE